MDLSIIIVNWNTVDYLKACLRSIETHAPSCQYEVIVVDNASSDGSAEMVEQSFPGVKLIANSVNEYYAEGNNIGIRESRGEFVLLLNPDTKVKSGALDALLAFGREHPDAAAVGCRLVSPDGTIQDSCRGFPDPSGVFFEYMRISRAFPESKVFGRYRMTWFDYKHVAEVDQPMGSCLLLSRKALDEVDMFDKEFPIFFNDVDWCYRAKRLGWKVYFTPDAEVIHHGGAATAQVSRAMKRESHRSLWRFYRKHYRKRISRPLYWFICAAIALNSFFASTARRVKDIRVVEGIKSVGRILRRLRRKGS